MPSLLPGTLRSTTSNHNHTDQMSDTKYTLQGGEVHVLAETPKGFLVCAVYDDDEGLEPIIDEDHPFLVERVYDSPPTQRTSEDLARLEQEMAKLRAERTTLLAQQRASQAEYDAIRLRCAGIEQLRGVFDYIDGKITHYVLTGWDEAVSVVPFGDTKAEYARERDGKKLLVLFGDSKRNLSWKLNQYSDGSGQYSVVYPATSEEEAKTIARRVLSEKLQDKPRESVLSCADKFGVPVPPEYRAAILEQDRARLMANIKEAKDKITKYEAELNAINS